MSSLWLGFVLHSQPGCQTLPFASCAVRLRRGDETLPLPCGPVRRRRRRRWRGGGGQPVARGGGGRGDLSCPRPRQGPRGNQRVDYDSGCIISSVLCNQRDGPPLDHHRVCSISLVPPRPPDRLFGRINTSYWPAGGRRVVLPGPGGRAPRALHPVRHSLFKTPLLIHLSTPRFKERCGGTTGGRAPRALRPVRPKREIWRVR